MRGYLLFIPILVLFSCKSAKLETETALIQMEKTPCYGPCPVYKLEIFKNGLVKLNTKQNLDFTGSYTSKISKSQIKTFQKKFKDISFFSLKDEYTSSMTDLPSTLVTYSLDGQTKTVIDYDKAPEKLRELEAELERLIKSLKWHSVN